MSADEIRVTAVKEEVYLTVDKPLPATVRAMAEPGIKVIAAGNVGPPGPQGQWVAMSQAEYNALPAKNPATLYVIVE